MTELANHITEAYRAISKSDSVLTIEYGSEWGASTDQTVGAAEQAEALAGAMELRRRHDIERRVTTVGPHRDEPVLNLDHHDARVHGSQGEQRTIALALRLAVHSAVTERIGIAPVLLLDDVFSELDGQRAEQLAAALPPAQTMITSARPEDVPMGGRRWAVGGGEVLEAAS